MSHSILHLTAKNFEKPDIAEKMQPSAVQKHSGEKGQIINEGETVAVMFRIFSRDNPEVIGEFLKEFRRQCGFKQKDEPAQDDQHPCG